MFDSFQEALEIAGLLNKVGAIWAFCGGIAVAVHGYVRATEDVDIVVHAEYLDKIDTELRARGWIIHGQPQIFRDGTACHRRVKISGSAHFVLDLLVPPKGINYLVDKSEALLAGEKVFVISKNNLIAMKERSNREKDRLDIKALRGELP